MLPLLRLLSLVLVVLVPFGVSACGGDDDGEAGGETTATEEGGEEAAPSFELKIGPILPLTGDLASFGPSQAEAARIAVERIEEALQSAGVEDVTVTVLDVEDDGGRSQAGVEAATKFVQTGDGDVILGAMARSGTIP